MIDRFIGPAIEPRPIATTILKGKYLTGREQFFYSLALELSKVLGLDILGFAKSKALDEFVVCLYEDGNTILRLQCKENKYVIYKTINPVKLYEKFYLIT